MKDHPLWLAIKDIQKYKRKGFNTKLLERRASIEAKKVLEIFNKAEESFGVLKSLRNNEKL